MSQPVITWRFPDVQRVLVDALTVFVGPDRTDIETPDDLQARLPFVRIVRTGGGRGRLNDLATVEIDVFAGSYAQAQPLAESISQWLCGPPPPIPVLDRVVCAVAPRELPWGDVNVRRLGATYQVVTRRVRA